MKIYLTARWDRREELKQYRAQLRALNHEILGTWIDSTLVLDDSAPPPAKVASGDPAGQPGHSDMSFADFRATHPLKSRAEMLRAKVAEQVFAEIIDCEALVAFTDPLNNTRGAAYAEFGGALFQGKRVWIVGPRMHVLHYFKDVPQFDTFEEFLAMLAALGQVEQILEQRRDKPS